MCLVFAGIDVYKRQHLRRQNRAPASRMVRGGIGFDLAAKTAIDVYKRQWPKCAPAKT